MNLFANIRPHTACTLLVIMLLGQSNQLYNVLKDRRSQVLNGRSMCGALRPFRWPLIGQNLLFLLCMLDKYMQRWVNLLIHEANLLYSNMARGQMHRRRVGFHKGGMSPNKGRRFVFQKGQPKQTYLRLPMNKFSDMVSSKDDILCIEDVHGTPQEGTLLRPRASEAEIIDEYLNTEDKTQGEKDSYRILHLGKTANLWNETFRDHITSNPGCTGDLEWDLDNEVKWGLCWRMRLKCQSCSFYGKVHKLYVEIDEGKPGQKAAAPNKAVQVGLSHSMISNTSFRNILLGTNIPAPAMSSMQKNTNAVGETLIQVNEDDMAKIRQDLKDTSIQKDLPDEPIHISGDGRYNNNLFSGTGNTPLQPATQVVYTAIENVTNKKQIIAVSTRNKLCSVAQRLRKSDTSVTCPNHAGHCSANLGANASIANEREMATECMKQINDDGLKVKYFTSDGDSKAAAGIKDADNFGVPVECLRDTRHLVETHRKLIKSKKFSQECFPGRTKKLREDAQKRFALDLSRRCAAEFEGCHKTFGSSAEILSEKLKNHADVIISCYMGDCTMCRKRSFVCKGLRGRHWENTYLQPGVVITPNDSDVKVLVDAINFRFSTDMIQKTFLNSNSQKCEAVHRAYSRCNPKVTTMSRNFKSRIHSAVHLTNRGIANSTIAKCEAVGARISKGSRVVKQLKSEQQKVENIRIRQKSMKQKSRRAELRKHRYSSYDEAFLRPDDYKKDMMDLDNELNPIPNTISRRQYLHHDHNYDEQSQ